MADRGLLLSHLPTEGRRGFEIGALVSPFLSKADHDITLVDRLSTADLRAKFATEPGFATDQIAEVDVVVQNGELFEALAWRRGEASFDYAIASHVIEHVPNLIAWLADIAKLVRVGGRLLLVSPDKRYTFDYLRDTSKLADLIDNWIRDCRRPTPGQIFDYNAHAAQVDKLAAWSGRLDAASLIRYGTPASALELSVASHRDNAYLDSHCWVFTPASLLGICADLAEFGLLHWKLAFFADTRRGEEDFGLVLERTAASESPADLAATFRLAIGQVTPPESDLRAEFARLRAELDGVLRSRSWRLTAPLRWVGAALRRATRR